MPALLVFCFILFWSVFSTGCSTLPSNAALTPHEIEDGFRRVAVLEKHGEKEAAEQLRYDLTRRIIRN